MHFAKQIALKVFSWVRNGVTRVSGSNPVLKSGVCFYHNIVKTSRSLGLPAQKQWSFQVLRTVSAESVVPTR